MKVELHYIKKHIAILSSRKGYPTYLNSWWTVLCVWSDSNI